MKREPIEYASPRACEPMTRGKRFEFWSLVVVLVPGALLTGLLGLSWWYAWTTPYALLGIYLGALVPLVLWLAIGGLIDLGNARGRE